MKGMKRPPAVVLPESARAEAGTKPKPKPKRERKQGGSVYRAERGTSARSAPVGPAGKDKPEPSGDAACEPEEKRTRKSAKRPARKRKPRG